MKISLELDMMDVIVEYEYFPPEDPVYNLDSPLCGPGHGAEVSLLAVHTPKGDVFDPYVLNENILSLWEEKIIQYEQDKYEEVKWQYYEDLKIPDYD